MASLRADAGKSKCCKHIAELRNAYIREGSHQAKDICAGATIFSNPIPEFTMCLNSGFLSSFVKVGACSAWRVVFQPWAFIL